MSINNDDEVNRIASAIQKEQGFNDTHDYFRDILERIKNDPNRHRYCGEIGCTCSFSNNPYSIYWDNVKNGNGNIDPNTGLCYVQIKIILI